MREIPPFGAYLFDLDGTVYLGPELIAGADRAVASLRAAGRYVRFLSNKPIATAASYADKLSALGIPTPAAHVLNSSQALAYYLAREMPGARVYAIAELPVLNDLTAAGMSVVTDPRQTDVVVVSWDREFSYAKLDTALQALRHGARLVATNPDVTCPMPGGTVVPDCGTLVAAVEACSGRQVEAYAGKPSLVMAEMALAQLPCAAHECLMVGDRVTTDILFGHNAGMATALVLTGVGRGTPLAEAPAQPDFVLDSIADLCLATP